MSFAKLGINTGLEIVYLETGRPNSTLAKQLHDHKKLVRMFKDSIDTTRKISKLQRIFNKTTKRELLAIFTINITGDALELYTMRKESGIYKYGLLERAPIPLRLTSHNDMYSLIHVFHENWLKVYNLNEISYGVLPYIAPELFQRKALTLRTAVACILFKILYDSEEVYSDHSMEETSTTVSTPKR
ncbi:11988_t:CDS:2 [Dentiscutata erythropus]|uniref:11988_t:CDS:1 n=1 Tax=Dentiscutata erythropus TaxID=1348616 RepID=A0A9N8VQJ0_9GLOM|nr:11988_t:CDS:2 [Dentiscutata erythropus]